MNDKKILQNDFFHFVLLYESILRKKKKQKKFPALFPVLSYFNMCYHTCKRKILTKFPAHPSKDVRSLFIASGHFAAENLFLPPKISTQLQPSSLAYIQLFFQKRQIYLLLYTFKRILIQQFFRKYING